MYCNVECAKEGNNCIFIGKRLKGNIVYQAVNEVGQYARICLHGGCFSVYRAADGPPAAQHQLCAGDLSALGGNHRPSGHRSCPPASQVGPHTSEGRRPFTALL